MFNLEKLLSNDFETKLVLFSKNNVINVKQPANSKIVKITISKSISQRFYEFLSQTYLKFCKLLSIRVVKPKFWGHFSPILFSFLNPTPA